MRKTIIAIAALAGGLTFFGSHAKADWDRGYHEHDRYYDRGYYDRGYEEDLSGLSCADLQERLMSRGFMRYQGRHFATRPLNCGSDRFHRPAFNYGYVDAADGQCFLGYECLRTRR